MDLMDVLDRCFPMSIWRIGCREVIAAFDPPDCEWRVVGPEWGFAAMYARLGRPRSRQRSLRKGSLLQAFYSVRSEQQLMERLDFACCFAGLSGWGSMIRSGIIRCSRRSGPAAGGRDHA